MLLLSWLGFDFAGHDSERMTETNDMQDTGYMRNFVTVKSARFSIVVEDEPGYFISLYYVQAYLVAWCWTQEPC